MKDVVIEDDDEEFVILSKPTKQANCAKEDEAMLDAHAKEHLVLEKPSSCSGSAIKFSSNSS